MVWVYYSSVILYFGAEFAKRYALAFKQPIIPFEYAEVVHTVEIASKEKTLQKADKELTNLKQQNNN